MVIPDKVDGDVLFARELWKFVDQTDGTFTFASGPSEISLGSVIIPANTISGGVFALATCAYETQANANQTNRAIYRLRIGSATNLTDITQIGGSYLERDITSDTTTEFHEHNLSFQGFHSGADFTEQNVVHATVVTEAGVNTISKFRNITVLGF